MQKRKLDRFIQKYNLSGNAEQVKWSFQDDSLSTDFITEDKSLLGSVVMKNVNFENAEIGVYDTGQLKGLLNVLGEDIDMNIMKFGEKPISLKVKNNNVSVDFNLSDLSIIPSTPAMKHIPDFGTEIEIDANFIETFIKGKSALADTTTFAIVKEGLETKIIIGYSDTNTNRVTIPVKTRMCDLNQPIYFNADLFKEVLVSNKECSSAILKVSNEGLAKVNFKVDDYDSEYYIVAMQDVD